jgi:hypothetical protein
MDPGILSIGNVGVSLNFHAKGSLAMAMETSKGETLQHSERGIYIKRELKTIVEVLKHTFCFVKAEECFPVDILVTILTPTTKSKTVFLHYPEVFISIFLRTHR